MKSVQPFRPSKGGACVNKIIRLSKQTAEQLGNIAAMQNISLNKLVNECIVFALENMDVEDGGMHHDER